MEFIGRESELGLLGRIFAEERVKTCMVYGRRRIGKTSTILKFIEGRRSLYIDLVRGPEVRNI
ncbi:MAG: ATP-binding protein, partial [Candidatus Methanomethylophilaceae archaeon]|nr:ATP-binding protein [Candidatus Methanomethylophilaceae archaeon]